MRVLYWHMIGLSLNLDRVWPLFLPPFMTALFCFFFAKPYAKAISINDDVEHLTNCSMIIIKNIREKLKMCKITFAMFPKAQIVIRSAHFLRWISMHTLTRNTFSTGMYPVQRKGWGDWAKGWGDWEVDETSRGAARHQHHQQQWVPSWHMVSKIPAS